MDFQLPQRSRPGRTSFRTNTETIRNWVDELPLLDTERSCELVSGALEQINALEIPANERYEALELFTVPVMSAADGLRKTFIGKPLPLSGDDRLHATRTIELYNRMATGYRILVDAPGASSPQPQLQTAIHRALRYLSGILLTNYQIYVQYPDGLWRVIHGLYALAEKFGVAASTITDTTLHPPVGSTIDGIYRQILLLSLACPYRLRQNEILPVYNALPGWADASELFHAGDAAARGMFITDLASDDPPAYRALQEEAGEDNQRRILDTSRMQQQLQQIMASQSGPADKAGALVGSTVIQRLMLAWGVRPKRRFGRHPEDTRINLVIGLNAIHQMSAVPAGGEKDNNDTRETIHNHHYLQDPTFEATTRARTYFDTPQDRPAEPLADSDTLLKGAYLASPSTAAHRETWKMTDTSAGGYCLLHEAAGPSSARVGELVAIPAGEDTPQPGSTQLGIVRWLRFTSDRGLELGLQLLAPGARSVQVIIAEAGAHRPEKLQGILLPEIRPLGQPASLLLPSLPSWTGYRCSMEDGDRKDMVKLNRQLENTGCFAQYDFTPADQ